MNILLYHTTSNYAQTWVTKTVNPDLFTGSHLLTTQKSVSECYAIKRYIGMIVAALCTVCTLLDILGGLPDVRNRTKISIEQSEMK